MKIVRDLREVIGVAPMDVESIALQSTYDQVKTKDVKRHHFASNLIMRYITGAKFEQHNINISRDILDCVIYLCTKTISVTSSILISLGGSERKYSKKVNTILVLFEKSLK